MKQSPANPADTVVPSTVTCPSVPKLTVAAEAVTVVVVHSSTSHNPLSFSSTQTLKSSKE